MTATWLDDHKRQSWGTDGGSFTGGPAKIVLHTTEGGSWPRYQEGATCPHVTWLYDAATKRMVKRQHVPLNVASRALKNPPGGVQTNRDHAIQVEVIGTCAKGGPGIYWPGANEDQLRALGVAVRELADAVDVPLHTVATWRSYPSSYGLRAGQRLSLSEWDGFHGICGHQHVPENDHGDPGSLDVVRALALGGGVSVVDKPQPQRPTEVHATKAPPFPLPAGHSFGPKSGPARHHSGYYSATDRKHLREWQARMRARGWKLDVDGLYGPATARVAEQFKRQVFSKVDNALIGAGTWAAAWTEPVK